ncbi:pyridine nucleotide-disulfide oxidoreductase [Streptomyces sp. NPDC090025]|uniref:pyridine nucleotide-disulfide oxidoreductase n=1 Tax=Streptomyces sp. NPDC090025 TaxID=3365922 RepID=UPI00383737E8
MAAGLGMRTVLVEPDALCRNLRRIPALENVLGGHTSGIALAEAVEAELTATPSCRLLLGRRAVGLRAGATGEGATDERVTVTLDDGTRLTAPYAVVATGVGPQQPSDVPWIDAPGRLELPPLWRADGAAAEGRTLLVLGGDRPIGTFLRAHPETATRLLVAYPAADAYKVVEIADDPRVTLLPVARVALARVVLAGGGEGWSAELTGPDGTRRTVTVAADAAYVSIGNAPTAPPGDLAHGPDGYCPPPEQHPRVLIAGDLRSARYQRIMTAMGSGAEAALRAYYATRS